MTGRADMIIREFLAPAVEQCLDAARKVASDFAVVADFDDRQLLAAAPKHRDAALALDAASVRYNAVRDSQRRLTVGLRSDLDDIFFEFANLRELYGPQWPGRHTGNWSPFPPNGRQRMAFLVREVEPVPVVVMWTAGRRDEEWAKAFGPGRPGGMAGVTRGGDLVGRDDNPLQPAHHNQMRPAGL